MRRGMQGPPRLKTKQSSQKTNGTTEQGLPDPTANAVFEERVEREEHQNVAAIDLDLFDPDEDDS